MRNIKNLYQDYQEAMRNDKETEDYNYSDIFTRNKGFCYLNKGGFRVVYRRKNVVIKFPMDFFGLEDNICEAYAYHKYRKGSNHNGEFFAPCKLLSDGCLLMNFVNKMEYKDMPRWTFYIDSSQCGMFNGRVVAYDSGDSLGYLKEDALWWAGIV